MAYTFIYSKRSGTPAATMDDQIPEEIKRVRLQTLMDVQNEISYELNKPMEGQVFDIIVEGPSPRDEDMWFGRTSGNKMVLFLRMTPYQLVKLYQLISIKLKHGFVMVVF